MKARIITFAGAGVAALLMAAALGPVASAEGAGTPASSHRGAAPAQRADFCFKNLKVNHFTGASIPSVNYDDQNSILDSQAADDFTLTQPCLAKEVDVAGTFTQQTNLDWETVFIYPDGGGKPGFPAIWVQSALNGKQGKQPGDFKIKFGPLQLQPGTYWISVQAQLKSGQWAWDNTSDPSGSSAVFQSPDGGFPGCPTWTPIQTCFSGTPAPGACRGTSWTTRCSREVFHVQPASNASPRISAAVV